VHITGAVTNPEDFYRQMDVFLLTSQFEGVPLVLLEAMASGVPVVATAVGAIPRILKQGAGYAVARQGLDLDESEREFFADRMVDVATSPKRRQMGAAARNKAKRLYSTATYRRTVSAYFDKRFSQ